VLLFSGAIYPVVVGTSKSSVHDVSILWGNVVDVDGIQQNHRDNI